MTEPGPRIVVAAGLVWLAPGRVLVHRRSPHARFGAGSLELPGGKLERGEAPTAALARELVEEWGPGASRLRVGPVAEVLHHVYPPPGPEVVLLVYHVDGRALSGADGDSVDSVDSMGLAPTEGFEILAFDVEALPVGEFLEADRDFVASIGQGGVRSPWAGGGPAV